MATEVAALVARLEADTRDFQKGLKGAEKRLKGLEREGQKTRKGLGQTDKATQGLTKSVKGFGLAVAGSFAAKAVLDFAKNAVRAASDLGESINAVEVTFGDAAEGIKTLGVEAATAVGLSNAEFNSLAVGFSAFVEKIAVGGDSVVDVMEELTGRASDFASVMNIEVAEAAQIFQSGLAGETEPLRKFGIDLSAAAVTAEALALGLAGSSSELTEQDKILARFELLMRQTNKTAGDFSNTIGDYANNARVSAAETENLAAVVGESLIPAFQAFDDLKVQAISEIAKLFLNLRIVLADADEGAEGLAHTLKARVEVAAGGALKPLEGFVEAVDAAATRGQATNEVLFALAEVFELTAEDAFFLNKELEASDKAFGKTMLTTGALSRGMEELDKWLGLVAQRELLETIPRTQELRDAVLDGKEAIDDLAVPDKKIAKAFTKIKTEAELAAIGIQRAETALKRMINPAFRLIDASFALEDALAAQDEVMQDVTASERDRISAGKDAITAFNDLMFAADEYAQVLDTDVAGALRFMVSEGIISNETLQIMLGHLASLESFEGGPTVVVDYIEKNRAAFDRFIAINTTEGPGVEIQPSSTPFPIPVGVGHSGGTIPGLPGANVPIIAQAGETLRTVQQERALQNGGGGGGTTVIVQGFVGSELQLAAQIDKLLTRRSKTSKLGF